MAKKNITTADRIVGEYGDMVFNADKGEMQMVGRDGKVKSFAWAGDNAQPIPSYATTAKFQTAIQDEVIKPGDVVYVADAEAIAYINSDGSLATLTYTFPTGIVPYVSLALIFKLLADHIENDKGYWRALQEYKTTLWSMQQLMVDNQRRITALETDEALPPPEKQLDMSKPTVLHTPPLIGALGLEIGGINLTSPLLGGWTVPADVAIIFSDAGLIDLLNPEYIKINDVAAALAGSTVVLELLNIDGDSARIWVKAGDRITSNGIGDITYYPLLQTA